MKGLVFDIKHFALHDGPGIRQTVFFKGCPLRCVWCHNPESWSNNIQEFRNIRKIGSQKFEVTELIGKWYTIEEVLSGIKKDIPFYNQSGGGVTFSGGEPILQHEFVAELAKKCKEQNIHTLLDTCGYAKYDHFQKINPFIDLYYYDVKHVNNEKHKRYTGVGTEFILSNLEKLITDNKNIVIRIPIIPGFNNHENDIVEITKVLKDFGLNKLDILPYHEIGKTKFKRFGIEYNKNIPEINDDIDLNQVIKIYQQLGFQVRIEN